MYLILKKDKNCIAFKINKEFFLIIYELFEIIKCSKLYKTFVDELLDEILLRIKKSDKIVVLSIEIHNYSDLLLSEQLTKEKNEIFYLTGKTKLEQLIDQW